MIKTLFFSVKNAQCVTAELLFLVEYFATSTCAFVCVFEVRGSVCDILIIMCNNNNKIIIIIII